ncbi:hypothetical protein RIF29_05093 [Crotalaria pallida]|uniref:CCHC-type domain-containing protein n=1 Tax=Crotalaria pallida TaxID=3830 RepID=A0AAN9J2Q9_CROPI
MKNMQQPLSTPPSQQETISSHYSPKLAKRMQQDTCYTCKQIGHWSWDCPSKFNNNNNKSHFSPNNNNHYSNNTKPISSPSSSPINNHYSNTTTKPFSPSSPENIWCRCGHGFCEVRTVQNGRNKGRKYYACPIKRGKSCTFFYKWCDDGKVNESDRQPPPYKYPECECRAGVCAKVEVKESSGMVKYYFTCPVGEVCFLWEEVIKFPY